MKLKNINITTQLNLGMGIIFLFVALLGIITLLHGEKLWQNTKGLYEHPLTVQRAISAIEIDTLAIRLEMTQLVLQPSEQGIKEATLTMSVYDAAIVRQIEVLYGAYLGPSRDIDNAYNSLVQYQTLRGETIRLLQEGKIIEARERSKVDGMSGIHFEKVIGDLKKIDEFARNRADQFYNDSQRQKKENALEMVTIIGMVLLVSGIIVILLRRGILLPLKELTSVTEAFQEGRREIRSKFISTNEFGKLTSTFNAMAHVVESEIRNKENIVKISNAMVTQGNLPLFCQEFLQVLMQQTQSQLGAVYVLNYQRTAYEYCASIGLNSDSPVSFSAIKPEGEFAIALLTKKIEHITGIPEDTPFNFSTVSGVFTPKEILTIPIVDGKEVVVMISLGSIYHYNVAALRLVNDIWPELTARLNGVMAFRQANELSQKLQETNSELEEQTKELMMQSDALTEQNIELEIQKKMLDDASKLKSSFLSNMSHELRTPLNSVIALSSVLNRRLHGLIPDEEYGYLAVIERNGKNLLALVNDILDLSRIEAGKEEIAMSPFTLRELIGEVVDTLEPQAQEKGIILLYQITGDFSMNSDLAMCRHILENIISNAVKFTSEGSVEISVALVGTDVQIAIKDTGIGIGAEHLSYIFDEFRQADESTARKYGGTGLGLAIAQKYARLLGGSISVNSRINAGSTFIIKLPQNLQAPSVGKDSSVGNLPGASIVRKGTVPTNGLGKCILLVEDSEPAMIQMKDILLEAGYKLTTAHNGTEALHSIAEVMPDAIILDLMMPEMDGFQLIREIRSHEQSITIPVLILTAKHITKEEQDFFNKNQIFQLIRKGSIGKQELLEVTGNMVWQRESKQAILLPPKSTRPPIHGRPQILIVEDNIDNIVTLRALLSDDYDIIEGRDGEQGLEQAKLHEPALILLDISLPIMDGFQVLTELKNYETLRNIPVIALTARAMVGDREEILDFGFDDYISKPIDGILLEKSIRRALDAT